MVPVLLERQGELQALFAAAERAVIGQGSIALVSGEAGIGKTSVVQSLLGDIPQRLQVLIGGCEDLLTPRALGPLRDAVRGASGPLAQALAAGAASDAVLTAALEQLATPSVLVVEDAHWADGATLDVLRYVGRRIPTRPALLVITYRDDLVDRNHPLRTVLGNLPSTDTLRLRLDGLTTAAIGTLAGDMRVDAAEVRRLTGGNPFYVTEVLANGDAAVPVTIVDAVLGRLVQLSHAGQRAVERLAVIPAGVETSMLRSLHVDLDEVAEGEAAGLLAVRGNTVAFRHELARRAVAESLPRSTRLALHREVLDALVARPDPDPYRVLHHAVQAGDDAAVVVYGQRAARDASRSGAHRQAAACYAEVIPRAQDLPPKRLASLNEAYSYALSNSNQLHAAARAAAVAVVHWEQVGKGSRLARGLVTLTRQLWLTEQTDAARDAVERALALAEPMGETADHAFALLGVGGFRVLVDDELAGIPVLTQGLQLAERLGADDIVALCRNYLGSARLQLGDEHGRDELLDSVAVAIKAGRHEYVMRGYYNLVEGLWRLGRYDEALGFVDRVEAYGRDRDFPVYAYMVEARHYRRMAMRGQWAEALAGLHEMIDRQRDPGMVGRETLPFLARLSIRCGAPDAAHHLAQAVAHADRAKVLDWLVPTGLAAIEHAWLTGRPELAGRYPDLLLERTDRPGCSVWRGELVRYLKRLGRHVDVFPDCPEQFAAGVRGDWQRAALAWQELGDPYERALELADSGQEEATVEAMHILDSLGARPAATLVRHRLRELGVARLPRRQSSAAALNPAGLTTRQIEIMRLVAEGMSNAEIARLLVVSPRTVDHHVAAVFLKLGVHTRRDATTQFAQWTDAADASP